MNITYQQLAAHEAGRIGELSTKESNSALQKKDENDIQLEYGFRTMPLPIKARRLYITKFYETMAESVHTNSLDEDNKRFVPDEVFETIAEAQSVISAIVSYYSDTDAPQIYAVMLNDGQHIGHVQAVPISEEEWEVGYHIAKPFTGKGYATEAVNAFLPVITRHLDIQEISGITHVDNIASRRVLEKCGFVMEYEGMGQYQGKEQHICKLKFQKDEYELDDALKQKLADKNKKLISMVIERAKRDFSEDIALIGLTGSFATGDFHEKSDLDLIIVNNTDKGWEISSCFILNDVGYDIYCTPWETRLAQQANLDNPGVSSLTDLKILYCAKPEYLERFNALKQKAIETMAKPIGAECLNRAKKHIDLAKQNYADMMLTDDLGTVRYASATLVYNLVNGIVNINNTCIKRGIKRYFGEISAYQYLPDNFSNLYMSVIKAKTTDDIRDESRSFLTGVIQLHDVLHQKYVEQPVPTYENLRGTYEEAWCNNRNKVLASVAAKDKSYAFLAALGAQDYFDEMTANIGTKKFDLMQYFDVDNLDIFRDAFIKALDEYQFEYDKVERKVLKFDTFDELYNYYMNVEEKI